jgi:hypothetical protein
VAQLIQRRGDSTGCEVGRLRAPTLGENADLALETWIDVSIESLAENPFKKDAGFQCARRETPFTPKPWNQDSNARGGAGGVHEGTKSNREIKADVYAHNYLVRRGRYSSQANWIVAGDQAVHGAV